MKQKLSSKSKILIAASLLGIFLIGAIVSIVLVLAANTQNVLSNITVSYKAEGVAAKVSANYAIIPFDSTMAVSKTAMKTSSGTEEITFDVATEQTTNTISPAGDIELDPQNQKVVFEYVFENLADTAFAIQLTDSPTGVNMTETYYVSGTRLSESDYRTRIVKTELTPQALTSIGQKVYIYIMASVTNENLIASYNGSFAWSLVANNTIDITLDVDGATSTLKIIPNTITGLESIAMPVLNTLPEKNDYNFDGFYTEGDVQYINSFGASSHIADLEENAVLYAAWNQDDLIIEDNVVYGLTNVGTTSTTVEIPEGTTTIGDSALSESNITSVTIPNSVETIGNNAFYNSTNLETITIGDTAQVAAYADGDSNLKFIGAKAFKGCSALTELVIPNGLKGISAEAFQNCTALTNLVIPKTVTTIAAASLSGTSALQSLEFPYILGDSSAFYKLFGNAKTDIPTTLTTVSVNGGTIPDYAFYGCSNLTSISIGNNIKKIGSGAFDACNKLTYNQYGNAYYLGNSENPYVALIKAKSTSITSCEINENTKIIYDKAFLGCYKLVQIRNLSGLSYDFESDQVPIYAEVLKDNSEFSSIVETNDKYAIFTNGDEKTLLYAASSITSATDLPSDLTQINKFAFYYCSHLTEVTIPSGVTTIGENAFNFCSRLPSITIPASVSNIGTNAFSNCSSLVQIKNLSGLTLEGYTAPSYAEVKTDNSEFSSTVEIGEKYTIFTNGSEKVLLNGLKSITTANDIPNDITQFARYAFYGCSSLTEVTIPTGVTSLSTGLFNSCSKLTSITIPNNITSVSGNAFRACSSLTSIVVEEGNSVYNSGNGSNCIIETATNTLIRGCQTTIIPDGITRIGGDAFSGAKFTELTIPSSVTSIGDAAFLWSGLTSITIPSSVIRISDGAFEGCSSLTSVIFENQTGWGAYSGETLKYEITDMTNANSNATNLKNLSSNSSQMVNWGYYILKREA